MVEIPFLSVFYNIVFREFSPNCSTNRPHYFGLFRTISDREIFGTKLCLMPKIVEEWLAFLNRLRRFTKKARMVVDFAGFSCLGSSVCVLPNFASFDAKRKFENQSENSC